MEIKVNNYNIKITKDGQNPADLESSISADALKVLLKKKLKQVGDKFNQFVEKL
jgi:hypothetical protein